MHQNFWEKYFPDQERRCLRGDFFPEQSLTEKLTGGTDKEHFIKAAKMVGLDVLAIPYDQEYLKDDIFKRKVSSTGKYTFYENLCDKGIDLLKTDLPQLSDITFSYLDACQKDFLTLTLLSGPWQHLVTLLPMMEFVKLQKNEPDLFLELMGKYTEFTIALGRKALEHGAKGLIIADDVAGDSGMMFSPQSLRRYYFPFLKKIVETFKDYPVFYHSDGNITSILEDLAAAGVNGIHSIERRTGMLAENILEDYPEFILIGGIDRNGLCGEKELLGSELEVLLPLAMEGKIILGSATGILDDGMELASFRYIREKMDNICYNVVRK